MSHARRITSLDRFLVVLLYYQCILVRSILLLLLLLLLSLVRVTIKVLSSIDGLLDLLVTHLLNRFGHIALCLEQSVHEIVLNVLLLKVLDGYNQSHQN